MFLFNIYVFIRNSYYYGIIKTSTLSLLDLQKFLISTNFDVLKLKFFLKVNIIINI